MHMDLIGAPGSLPDPVRTIPRRHRERYRDPCGYVKRDPPVTRTVAGVGAGYGPVELRATGSVNVDS